MRIFLLASGSLLALLAFAPIPLASQSPGAPDPTPDDELVSPDYDASPPFHVGESHVFRAYFGPVPAGEAGLEVAGREEVRGHDAYRFEMTIDGGVPLARVRNEVTSWALGSPLRSVRFVQDLEEVGTERYRAYRIKPESGVSILEHRDGEEEALPTDLPLDDVSFLYFARTLPLEVGDRYVLPRYFRETGNPVILEVDRRETVEVPAGTYETVVVRPTFESRGIFDEDSEAEVHFSDDWDRVVVKVSSRVSRLGSLRLELEEDPRARP